MGLQPYSCPECGTTVLRPEEIVGMWSGAKKNGKPAGGGWYQAGCPGCGVRLVAYEDVYDDEGNIPTQLTNSEPELYWMKDPSSS